ncbi:hypothetical protein [Microvirga sp. KLBC 81]|uniref:hypothetical protein n=1 Tax=Microvirga sp. KLBC 81 TaxID=1862707 RepID=UPI001057893C|nr:hypothetical protein [Microvirga sp. KLBC 81]
MDDRSDLHLEGQASTAAIQEDLLAYFGSRASPQELPVESPAAWSDDLMAARGAARRDTPAASLDLKRRAAGLRYVQPLADLEYSLSKVASEHKMELDGYRIGLRLIRDVALLNTFDDGPTNSQLRGMIAEAVFEQWPDISHPVLVQLATLTLQILENQRSKDVDKRFEVNVFDPISRTIEKLRFRYLEYTRSQSGEYRYRVSDEAVLVYGALADHDLDRDLQGALHKLVEEAIRHGQMERAERISREARGLARRIYLRIRHLISDLLTNARAVSWQADLQAPVEDARSHLEKRITDHERLREIVIERRGEVQETETATRLDQFMEDLEEERNAINLLLKELNSAHQKFMDAQAAAFRFRRRAHLPDPKEVATSLLTMSVEAMDRTIPGILRTMAPIDPIRFFDLDRLLVALRDQVEQDIVPDRMRQVADQPVGSLSSFSAEERDEAQQIVARVLAEPGDLTMDDIFARIDARASSIRVRRVAGMLLYGLYGMGARKARRDVVIDGQFENDLFEGKRLVFPLRRTS